MPSTATALHEVCGRVCPGKHGGAGVGGLAEPGRCPVRAARRRGSPPRNSNCVPQPRPQHLRSGADGDGAGQRCRQLWERHERRAEEAARAQGPQTCKLLASARSGNQQASYRGRRHGAQERAPLLDPERVAESASIYLAASAKLSDVMLYLKHTPRPPVGDFVEYLWVMSDAPPHSRERILPTGTLELVINLAEDQIRIYEPAGNCRRLSGTILSGAYAHPFIIDTAEHALAMGVHFRPGGASRFIRVPVGDLADGHVEAAALWGWRAVQLRERLCAAATHRERFRVLEKALLARVTDGRSGRPIVQAALRQLEQGRSSVREVVAGSGLSHRHFVSLFKDEVGMTPKLFSRIHRFQRTIAMARERTVTDWAALAVECGYYDQAHLIRDFVAFAGSAPGEYLRQQGHPAKDHHVVLAEAP
jgi:AraC-like DNA-binding protein